MTAGRKANIDKMTADQLVDWEYAYEALEVRWVAYYELRRRNVQGKNNPELVAAEKAVLAHIDLCRESRMTWQDIGQAMGGQTHQAARTWWVRRQPKPEPESTEEVAE